MSKGTKEESLDCDERCNTGVFNRGSRNTGNSNNGYANTGTCNNGSRNIGHYNIGDWNVGDNNKGDGNVGNCNIGLFNVGDFNVGDMNTGNWNKTRWSNGCFNTEEAKIYLFNKPSEWTMRDWRRSHARKLLCDAPNEIIEWVPIEKMSEVEVLEHEGCKTTGGFPRFKEVHKERQEWWDNLREEEKEAIKSIPNFDSAIFKEITGIDVEG
jgi:hypothetical protein